MPSKTTTFSKKKQMKISLSHCKYFTLCFNISRNKNRKLVSVSISEKKKHLSNECPIQLINISNLSIINLIHCIKDQKQINKSKLRRRRLDCVGCFCCCCFVVSKRWYKYKYISGLFILYTTTI